MKKILLSLLATAASVHAQTHTLAFLKPIRSQEKPTTNTLNLQIPSRSEINTNRFDTQITVGPVPKSWEAEYGTDYEGSVQNGNRILAEKYSFFVWMRQDRRKRAGIEFDSTSPITSSGPLKASSGIAAFVRWDFK